MPRAIHQPTACFPRHPPPTTDKGATVAVVARINGEQDHIRLQPANPEMELLILHLADIEVLVIVRKT